MSRQFAFLLSSLCQLVGPSGPYHCHPMGGSSPHHPKDPDIPELPWPGEGRMQAAERSCWPWETDCGWGEQALPTLFKAFPG